jgi:hypothetical protein
LKKGSVKNKIIWSVALALLLAGCGLKANPVPLVSVGLQNQAAQELMASVDGNTIVLTWILNDPAGRTRYITIERSRLGSPGNACKDCPRTFEKIGQLKVDDRKNNEYSFADSLAEKGQTYSYRLKLCDEADICSESQSVEADMK